MSRHHDPGTIEVTLSSRIADGETVGEFVERSAQLAELGVDHIVLVTTGLGVRRAI